MLTHRIWYSISACSSSSRCSRFMYINSVWRR